MRRAELEYAILSLRTPDKRGVSATALRCLHDQGASLLEEYAHVANGTFGLHDMTFSVPAGTMKAIKQTCERELAEFDAKVVPTVAPGVDRGLLYGLDVYAGDTPGIGCEIATRVVEARANIEQARGRRYEDGHNGRALFHGAYALRFENLTYLTEFRACTRKWMRLKGWEAELYAIDRGRRAGPVVVVNTITTAGIEETPPYRRN